METKNYFGPYQIIRKVGSGAFAEIFEVQKEGQFLALKKLKDYMKYDTEYIPLIKTEARLLSSLKDPDHFPLLFDSGEIEEEHYLTLELIDGLNLEEAIQRSVQSQARVSTRLACQILWEVARGLEHLHLAKFSPTQPTVHGDLRASNVMAARAGKVKLIDLGLKGGTFDYMPLERLHDGVITPFTDIFAAGHILYELLHRKPLFKGKTKLEAYFEMRDLKVNEGVFEPSIEPGVKHILVKCLNQDPQVHYRNVSELRMDLENFLNSASSDHESISNWVCKLKQANG